MRHVALSLGLLVGALGPARTARADLRGEAAAIKKALEADGAVVTQRPTLFLEGDRTFTFSPVASSDASAADECTSVVVLAARTTQFALVTGTDEESPDELLAHLVADKDARQAVSVEGFASAYACRSDARGLERLALKMKSVRGALEVLVARSPRPLRALDVALSSRAQGESAPRGDPGRPLVPAPLAQRRKNAAQRAKEANASGFVELDMLAGDAGTGEFVLKVGAGCHRFDVMAEPVEGHGVDVDAELRETDTKALLAQDRGETPDASVETCLAKATEVSLSFAGAPRHGRVFITDALFKLPAFIPEGWGPRTTAALATLVRRRDVPAPRTGPIATVLGVQGSTEVPVTVEPGRCYLAAAALLRGTSRGVRLVASASSRSSLEEAPPTGDGASVVFCSEDREVARLTVDAPGAAIWWGLFVWPVGDQP